MNIQEKCQICGNTLDMGSPCIPCQNKVKNSRKLTEKTEPIISILDIKDNDIVVLSLAPHHIDQLEIIKDLGVEMAKRAKDVQVYWVANDFKMNIIRKEDDPK